MNEMRLLTTTEAAKMLGVTVWTIRRLCLRNGIGMKSRNGRLLLPHHIPMLQSCHDEATKRRLANLTKRDRTLNCRL